MNKPLCTAGSSWLNNAWDYKSGFCDRRLHYYPDNNWGFRLMLVEFN